MLLFFLAVHCGIGVALGVAFAAMIVLLNVGGLKDLLEASSDPVTPLFMLYSFCGLTFGSLKMGVAIFALPYDTPRHGEGGEPPEPPYWH